MPREHQAASPNTPRRPTAKRRFTPLSPLHRPRQRHHIPGRGYGCFFGGSVSLRRLPNAGGQHYRPIGPSLGGIPPLCGDKPISLICKSYNPEDSSYIWAQRELHIQLPPSHPLAEGDRSRDHTLTMLQATYTTPEFVVRDIMVLPNLVLVAIPVETFIFFTAVTLIEEETVIHTPPHLHPISRSLALLPLLNGAFATVYALTRLLIGQRFVDPRRSHDPLRRHALLGTSHQPSTRLSPPPPPRRSKLSPCATRYPFTGLSLLARTYLSLSYYLMTPLV